MVTTLLKLSLFLKKLLQYGGKWLKIYLSDKIKKRSVEINLNNVGKIGTIQGDYNVSNYYITINVDKNDPTYDPSILKNQFKILKDAVAKEKNSYLSLDESFEVARSVDLTQKQKIIINRFKSLRWSPQTLNCLKVAFKLINLEDINDQEGYFKLRKDAFQGRYKDKIRKLYNLARSSYIDEFLAYSYVSPLEYSDDKIESLLTYFPRAIFLDDDAEVPDIVLGLKKREEDGVPTVDIYARGRRVDLLSKGYGDYVNQKIKVNQGKGKAFKMYVIN
ncbi:MAG: hypothetical protein QXP04_04865 [Candidatus Nanoarchaeia archaeon]|nr:hypothetical protein [Candidatus Jingweiarchaeum tengchongense]